MNKKLLQKYWIDVVLAISFVLSFTTGVIKLPILLGKFSFSKLTLLTLMRVHDISGIIMGLLVLVHIIQHWKWIVTMSKNIFKKK
jgi:hypothetical protein